VIRRPFPRGAAPGACPASGFALASVVPVAVAVFLIGASPADAATCVPGSPGPSAENRMMKLVNKERRAAGLRPLRTSPRLRAHARAESRLLARGAPFQHRPLKWAGRGSAAQNLAMAPTVPSAFAGMMDSPPHRRNMMGARWRTIGIGAAGDCRGSVYFTLNIAGAPRR
jgi:uncharacterized protein YkwD